MTDPTTAPTEPPPPTVQERVHVVLFGFRNRHSRTREAKTVERFLLGEDVFVDHDVANDLRIEFSEQEKYRSTLLRGIQKISNELLERACENTASSEYPVTSVDEAYWRGYRAGRYQAYSSAAVELGELHILASMVVEETSR